MIDQWQDETYGDFGIDTSAVGTSGTTRRVNYQTTANHNVGRLSGGVTR